MLFCRRELNAGSIDIDVSRNNATLGGCCRCQHDAAVNTWDARDKTSHDWVIAVISGLDLSWCGGGDFTLTDVALVVALLSAVRLRPLHFNSRRREEVRFSGERKGGENAAKKRCNLEYKQVVCSAQEEVEY